MIDCEKCKYYHKNCNVKFRCQNDVEQIRAEAIDGELQNFAQWLWDSNYLVDEAFTIRLVAQYKAEQRS